MLSTVQIQRLIKALELIEANIQDLKDEYLMAMLLEQDKLLQSKFDRKNYHRFKFNEKRV